MPIVLGLYQPVYHSWKEECVSKRPGIAESKRVDAIFYNVIWLCYEAKKELHVLRYVILHTLGFHDKYYGLLREDVCMKVILALFNTRDFDGTLSMTHF